MTPRQRELYDFISGWIYAKGYPPSFQEMGAAIRCTVPNIHRMITELEARGVITRTPGRRRSIRIVQIGAVKLSGEILELTDRYARLHGISRDVAANELLRAALEAA